MAALDGGCRKRLRPWLDSKDEALARVYLVMKITKGGNKGRRYNVLLMALLTLVGFGTPGWFLIEVVQGRSLLDLVGGTRPLLFQLFVGVVYGLTFGLVVRCLVRRPFMSEAVARYAEIGRQLARPLDIVLLSVCAGVGEEIMARGAIQYWLGILLTSVVFVVIHGYINPRKWKVSLLGVTSIAGNVPLGFMAEYWGLAAPMAAHTAFDVMVLLELARTFGSKGSSARPQTSPYSG